MRRRFADYSFKDPLKRWERGKPAIECDCNDFVIGAVWTLQQRLGVLNSEMIDEICEVSEAKLMINCAPQLGLAKSDVFRKIRKPQILLQE